MGRSKSKLRREALKELTQFQNLHHLEIGAGERLEGTHRVRKAEILLLSIDPLVRIYRFFVIFPVLALRQFGFIDLNTITLCMKLPFFVLVFMFAFVGLCQKLTRDSLYRAGVQPKKAPGGGG
jgi:hypothetical protein